MITIPKFRTASKQNIRTFALPFENRTYTFKMQYAYDSYNRIQTMTYPDGEVVSYEYNRGGMLNKVYGSVTRNLWEMVEPLRVQGGLGEPDGVTGGGGDAPLVPPVGPTDPQTITYRYPYIDSIIYNIFELKDSVIYGNGTRVRYEYDSLQRLSRLRSYTASGAGMQDISYTYDSAGNITHISNSAGSVSGLGGRYEGHYTYDNLYRLVAANGWWKNKTDSLPFAEAMTYASNGRLLRKMVNATTLVGDNVTVKNGDFRYGYAGLDNRTSSVSDRTGQNPWQTFQWDACGNMTGCVTTSYTASWQRTLAWDEENRLRTVSDRDYFSYYQYDAGGERTCKLTWSGNWSSINGTGTVYYLPEGATLYASPYLVITPQGYTKHYYAEAERITSQLGKGQFEDVHTPVVSDSLVQVKLQAVTNGVDHPATLTVPASSRFSYLDTLTNQQNTTSTLYFYHPDHLGSSSWITTTNGTVKQHLHYLPWGEEFVNQRSSHFDGVRYTFSAKERDTETGLSYFGARYYSSDLSIWLSVDPMAAKYPSLSPYVYCADNPVKLVDPNGEDIVPYGLLLYYGLEKGGRERSHESIKVGIYTVTPFYDNNNQLIGYNAVREYQQNGKTFWRAEYQMDPSDLQAFKDNVKYYERCANMIYAYGEPDWRYVAFGYNLMQSQFRASASIFGSIWLDAFHNPGFWLSMALSTGYTALNMRANSILTNARNGRGCFGLGSASCAEANLAGAKWVGENYRVSSNGRMWISADGLRQYRLPSYKPKLKKYQANFESRNTNGGEWINNGHLDVNM